MYPEIFSFFYPQVVEDEIFAHLNELTRKANLDREEVAMVMDVIFEPMNLVTGNQLSEYVAVSEEYVYDLADAPFGACALSLRGSIVKLCS